MVVAVAVVVGLVGASTIEETVLLDNAVTKLGLSVDTLEEEDDVDEAWLLHVLVESRLPRR